MNLNMQVNEASLNWNIVFDQRYERELNHRRDHHPTYLSICLQILMYQKVVIEYCGAWEYKVCIFKQTVRVFYTFDNSSRKVEIYYAGPKPDKTPLPSSKLPSLPNVKKTSSQNVRRSTGKKGRNRQR